MRQQRITPTPSHPTRQQLQVVLVELAEIERRLRDVNLVVARMAAELATPPTSETAAPASEDEASVRAGFVKPRSTAVMRTPIRASQRAELLAKATPSELQALLRQSQQQALTDASVQGQAIDDEWEAALGD